MTEIKEVVLAKGLGAIIQELNGQIVIMIILYVAVFLVVMFDLWSGLRKAKQLGQYRSSFGLRKTVDKMASYFNMLLVLTVIDIMQILSFYHLNPQLSFNVPLFPILTFVGTIFAGIIEFRSIYEKANDKDKGRYQETVSHEMYEAYDRIQGRNTTNNAVEMGTRMADVIMLDNSVIAQTVGANDVFNEMCRDLLNNMKDSNWNMYSVDRIKWFDVAFELQLRGYPDIPDLPYDFDPTTLRELYEDYYTPTEGMGSEGMGSEGMGSEGMSSEGCDCYCDCPDCECHDGK